jgi:DNA-directed RNA polymerase subunit omega
MVDRRNNTLMDPPIEDLLDKVDSKFTLVALSSKRARQINSYYNQLGEGLGMVVPPQVTSVSGKPLTIAFEEISARKATYHRIEPGEEDETEVAAEGEGADPLFAAVDSDAPDAEAAAAPGDAEAELPADG